ncbi:MAG: ABC transporter permease [Halobacteriota archaeon]
MGLFRYTLWRCLQAVPVVIGILTITFFLINRIPGDPVSIMLGPTPSAEMVEQVQARYGLDRPLHERYITYMTGVFQGNLGYSIYYDQPVMTKIIERLPVTAYLVFSAFAFALVTAIPLGVISAKRRNKPVDHVSRIVALIGVSTPSFWIGLVLIIVFAFQLQWLPATGLHTPFADPSNIRGASTQLDVAYESFKRLLMPMVALGTLQMASITRIQRSSMVDSLQNEYVQLARAFGVSERSVVWRHAFRPAQLPVITIVGLGLSTALGGAVLIETVFEINGMGRLIIQAINNQDYELVMGTTFMLGVLYIVGVIITDIAYAYIDPRVSYGEQ